MLINNIKQSLKWLSKQVTILIEKAKFTEHIFMVIMAVVIGALAGSGTLLIRLLIKEISAIAFSGDGDLLSNIIRAPWYIKLLAPSIGGLIVGPIIYYLAREAKRSGVPEVMQSVLLHGGKIRARVALIKAITSSITIGTGGSVGREGPIVQIGSSIGSMIGQFFKVSGKRMKTFVGCGAAAGIAAAFNAPIGGALFSVEIILQDYDFAQFSPIVISSVMATVISNHYEGNFAAFQLPAYNLTSPYEIIFYFILGIFCAVVGFIFIKTLYFSIDLFDKKIRIPDYLKPAIGGLLIGIIALLFPQIMGVGYESINNALHGNTIWILAIILVIVKIISTAITLGSGGSGGIFAPSLFMGAMMGIFFGVIVNELFPNITSDPGAYALVAMGGFVSATTHAPITAILTIFEITDNYSIILPLMITCIMGTIISNKLSRESIYTLTLVRRNIHLKAESDIDIMKTIYVKDVLDKNIKNIHETANFDEIVQKFIFSRYPFYPVVNQHNELTGIITLDDIKEYILDKNLLRDLLIAGDIANKELNTVTTEDNCQKVMKLLRKSNLPGILVVDEHNPQKILGMVWHRDIDEVYHREIERRELSSSFARKILMKDDESSVHFIEGHSLAEIMVPEKLHGKSIKELNIRARYGVDILLITRKMKNGSKKISVPNPDFIFSSQDFIVITGKIGNINLFKNL